MVASLSSGRVAEMNVHLSTQHALGQGLLQLRGQGLEIQGSAGPSLGNHLIQQLARDAVVVLLCHTLLLSTSSWYGLSTHNSLQARCRNQRSVYLTRVAS